jgi:hypothetical protein
MILHHGDSSQYWRENAFIYQYNRLTAIFSISKAEILGNASFEVHVILIKFCVKAKPTFVDKRVYQVSLIVLVDLYKQYCCI